MDLLEHLLAHDRWATLSLLQASRDLNAAQLDREFDIGHRTLRQTYQHLIHNIAFWSGLMVGRPLGGNPSEVPPDGSIDALIAWFERTHTAFADLAKQLAQGRRLADTFVDHYGENATFGGAILHNVLHSAEHRTEALHILRRLGVPNLEETDLLLWEYTVWRAR